MSRHATLERDRQRDTDTVTAMSSPRRPKGSLQDPLRVGVTIERSTDKRFAAMAQAAGVSKSALFEWMVLSQELSGDGAPIDWPDDGPEELPLQRTG